MKGRFAFPVLCSILIASCLFVLADSCLSQEAENIERVDSLVIARGLYGQDAGSWLGFRAGVQATDGPVDKLLAVSAYYELRSPNAASIVLGMHIWEEPRWSPIGLQESEGARYFVILDAAFRIRVKYGGLTAGLQLGVGNGPIPIIASFHYGTAIEYELNRRLSISISQKQYAAGDFKSFYFLGIVTRCPGSD